jgi:hypothetical protein
MDSGKIVRGICFMHVAWFVFGAFEEYRAQGLSASQFFKDETLEKVWDYLINDNTSLDASYSDIQIRLSMEAGKVFFKHRIEHSLDTIKQQLTETG